MNVISIEKLLQVRGRCKAIADEIGVTAQAVSQWTRVPAKHVLTVERLTGFSRTELRPDLYPQETTNGQTEENQAGE